MIASNQVNVSLCSLQYPLNEQLTSTKFLTELPSTRRNWHRRKTFCSFTIFMNTTIRSNTIRWKHSALGIDVIIIRVPQQRKPQ